MKKFVVITGEYPPTPGGVADYTWQVVHGLRRRGATVEIIVFQEVRGSTEQQTYSVGCAVNPVSLFRALGIIKRAAKESVLLVQYVPQMYGLKGMNLLWVVGLCRLKKVPMWVMFHEVQVWAAKGSPWKHRLLSSITRSMARRMANRADRCFVSTIPHAHAVAEFTRTGIQAEWLPVPSNLAVETDEENVRRLRAILSGGRAVPLVGHFGTYKGALRSFLWSTVARSRLFYPEWRFVFIGRGGSEFLTDLERQGILEPGDAVAAGELPSAEAACWIKACDVIVQPFPDGVSTKRASLMAALALGTAIISNLGPSSDSVWEASGSLHLVDRPDAEDLVAAVHMVLNDDRVRTRLRADSAQCYAQQFSLERTLRLLEKSTSEPREGLATP